MMSSWCSLLVVYLNKSALVVSQSRCTSMSSHPNEMDGYVAAASNALDSVQKLVPKIALKTCAGVILITSNEYGIAVSMSSGNGVLLSHIGEQQWSSPVAVTLGSMGIGATFGTAKKEMCIVLNHFAMKKLLDNEQGHLEFGASLGFAAGKGASAGAELDFGKEKHGGMASSFVYTFEKGIMITVQLERGDIKTVPEVNEAFYGTSSKPFEILQRQVAETDGAGVFELVQKMNAITSPE